MEPGHVCLVPLFTTPPIAYLRPLPADG